MIIFCVRGYNNLENKIDEVIALKFNNKDKNNQKNNINNNINNNKTRTLIHDVLNINNKKKKKNARNKSNKKNKKTKSLTKNSKISFIKGNSEVIKKSVIKSSIISNDNIEIENENEEEFLKNANDYELNNLPYELALRYDKRDFCDYYFSLIRTKQLVFFSFCEFNDYNSNVVKKFIFFLSFALHYTINALFFTDKTMHQILEDIGEYNILYQLPYITYSAIISTVILRIILSTLVLTEKSILEVKNERTKLLAEERKKKVLKCLIIKFSLFFALNLILLVAFWYYVTCFNALYENTQIDLIINSVISFALSCIYPFIINIIPAFFRMDSLKDNKEEIIKTNKKNKKKQKRIVNKFKAKKEGEYVYKVSNWLQIL